MDAGNTPRDACPVGVGGRGLPINNKSNYGVRKTSGWGAGASPSHGAALYSKHPPDDSPLGGADVASAERNHPNPYITLSHPARAACTSAYVRCAACASVAKTAAPLLRVCVDESDSSAPADERRSVTHPLASGRTAKSSHHWRERRGARPPPRAPRTERCPGCSSRPPAGPRRTTCLRVTYLAVWSS